MNHTKPSTRASRSILSLLLLAILTLVSCSSDPASPDQPDTTPDTVTIGGLFSRTGNWSTLGKAAEAALELAVDDINTEHGLNDVTLRFAAAPVDTKLDPGIAYSEMTRLHREGINVFVGPQSSAELARLDGYADSNGIVIISPSSTAGSLAHADNVFRLCAADYQEGMATAALMKANGIEEVIPIWRNDAGNAGLVTGLRASAPAHAIQVLDGASYTDGESATAIIARVYGQVTAARGRRGDQATAIYLASFDEGAEILAAAASDTNLSKVRWYAGDGIAQSTVLLSNTQAAAAAAAFRLQAALTGLDAVTSDQWADVAARIKARVGYEPDAFALNVYDAVRLIARGVIARNGKTDKDLGIAIERQAASYYGVTGWTVLDQNGDRKYGDFDFWEVAARTSGYSWVRGMHYSALTGQLSR